MIQPPLKTNPQHQSEVTRPSSVTVLAIIGIVLGAFGFLCRPIGVAMYFAHRGPPDPIVQGIRGDAVLVTCLIAATAMRWVLSSVLLVCSVGTINLRQWARKGLIGWAIAAFVLALGEFVMQYLVVQPKTRELLANLARTSSHPVRAADPYPVLAIFGLLWPTIMWIIMNRANVKAAFARRA